ncbi:orotidine-5'-phosphate decarboxylase [Pseudemcibacter aquimaris]|uniref:orotidine-5'-phosphate decarboxylase n=1 Tax=Pseudemcibacter aquimaris TaxID=2857064 RepID=UPI002013AA40|nr:orotidine-5'-phosphate decarboxylase [Pseudemcibacter aquimaris]MCC3862479.1 orotidine-5'-phosphate decarboxylase [Pseudemcibacter aquimaris]WDU59093.1 orotidine-5'-phosphate decarboxylase [Pseudemcibacter aquimaris]
MSELKPSERILCALDTISTDEASKLARDLGPHVGGVKLGLEFFGANGPAGFNEVANADQNIFLDLKLHDIPNTVAKAIHSLMPLKPKIMTIHTAGGPTMMRAAAEAATEAAKNVGCERPLIVGVTILTSLDNEDMCAIGYQNKVSMQVVKLARLAKESGLDGVVCSSHEIKLIKESCGKDFKLVVPGIRPAGSAIGDQKRTMTPAEAVALGADYLVIGRPITQDDNPAEAAKKIADEING